MVARAAFFDPAGARYGIPTGVHAGSFAMRLPRRGQVVR